MLINYVYLSCSVTSCSSTEEAREQDLRLFSCFVTRASRPTTLVHPGIS